MIEADTRPKLGNIYYGWVIVAVGFMILTVTFGIQYSFGVFFRPLQETFGWSRAATSWVMTIHLIVFGACLFPAGWAIDRLNTRILFSASAVLTGVSLILCSRISEPWQMYLLYGLPLAIGMSVCGPTINAMTTRWFKERRGLALGITSAGIGFGTLVGAIVSDALITSYGWRNAFAFLGIGSTIILLICANFIKRPPEPIGNHGKPAHAPARDDNQSHDASPEFSLRQAMKTRESFFIVTAFALTVMTLKMVMVHIAPLAIDIGITQSMAALAVGTIGGVSILGRIVMGFVQDSMGPKRAMIICVSIQAITLIVLPFVRADWSFFVFTVIFGFTYGGDVPQFPALAAQLFGVGSIGAIYGLMHAVATSLSAAGPLAAGYAFDLTGSYTIVFLSVAALLLMAVLSIYQIRPSKKQVPEKVRS